MVVDERVKPERGTDLIDVAVGPTAYPLDEFVLVLGIPTAYVTGQRICVHRSHRERLGEERNERERRRGERDTQGRVPWILSVREPMRVYVQPRPGSVAGTSSLSGCHTVR